MREIIYYMTGTTRPIHDLIKQDFDKFNYRPLNAIDFVETGDEGTSGINEEQVSEIIESTVKGYLDFAKDVPSEVRMEVLGFLYYLLIGMRREAIGGLAVGKLQAWLDSIILLEQALNEMFKSKPQTHV